jgi:hypothetical protein
MASLSKANTPETHSWILLNGSSAQDYPEFELSDLRFKTVVDF